MSCQLWLFEIEKQIMMQTKKRKERNLANLIDHLDESLRIPNV